MENLQKVALAITVIGAINWGLIGIFDFNLVDTIFGVGTIFAKIVYIIVGLCGIVNIGILFNHIEEK